MRSSSPEPALWAVILAGGIGSRFWPVSTPARPKQLLPLAGNSPLLLQTVERIRPIVNDARIRILTGAGLVGAVLEAVPGLGHDQFLLEPQARGTAPVLAWAAHEIARQDPTAVMVSLHADHVIEPADAFRELVRRTAHASVAHDRLFTVGAVPARPETGYGYVRAGAELEAGMFAVEEFVEKPDPATAERYVAEGYFWNTGLFIWPVGRFLAELAQHTPEIAAHLPLLDAGAVAEYFARVPRTTIDEGLLERSRRVAVAVATFDWDDVGAWDAVSRTRARDGSGNVIVGDAYVVDCTDCITWADEGAIVVYGAADLVVVRTRDITFVAPRERAPHLKELLERLPQRLVEPDGPQ